MHIPLSVNGGITTKSVRKLITIEVKTITYSTTTNINMLYVSIKQYFFY